MVQLTRINRILLFTILIPLTCIASQAKSQVAVNSATELFPDTTVFYAEVVDPNRIIELVKNHPLRPKIESLPSVQQALKDPEVRKLEVGVGVFEAVMGKPWDEAVHAITEGGVYFGFDAKTEGAALLVKAHDLETLIQLRKAMFDLVQGAAKVSNQPDPIKRGEYRGLTAYSIDKVKIAALDSWLLVTNKDELGKRIVDQYLDGGKQTLAQRENFQQALAKREESASAWSFTDVRALRELGVAKELYSGRSENPLAELLFGGLLANLQHTPFVTAAAAVTEKEMRVTLASPHNADWVKESREYYFGVDGSGTAPALIKSEAGVFSLSTYRDLSQMWLRAGDLMTDKANDDLAKADSQLTTFFSGKSFGEDILASLDAQMQLVVLRQDPKSLKPEPAVKLPAFALVTQMRKPEVTQPEFRRVFQSFVGFINVVGAMDGQPQLDLEMSKQDGKQLITATYLPEPSDLEARGARINFNFSPSVAFAGSRFIIASTKGLAEQLMNSEEVPVDATPAAEQKQATGHDEPAGPNAANTMAVLDIAWLEQLLQDNRAQLVANNMLEKGHSKEAAEQEIDVLMTILSLFENADLKLKTSSDQLELQGVLQIRGQ